MSKSYRHYSGGGHNDSHTKQGKSWKRLRHGQMRARLRDDYEDSYPIGKKCHRCNRYDDYDEDLEDVEMGFRPEGYDVNRLKHKRFGK